jgi:hypothetical protein
MDMMLGETSLSDTSWQHHTARYSTTLLNHYENQSARLFSALHNMRRLHLTAQNSLSSTECVDFSSPHFIPILSIWYCDCEQIGNKHLNSDAVKLVVQNAGVE